MSILLRQVRGMSAWLCEATHRAAASPVAIIFLLLGLGLAAYYPSLGGGFLWDDLSLVQHNPAIRSPALLGEIFRHHLVFDSPAAFYRPVQNLSFLGDYLLWELEPYGYRLTSLLLHIVNAGLLFLLLKRLLPRLLHSGATGSSATGPVANSSALALVISLGWLVHPVHSAAVAYISGRADSLALGFALLAWLAWERGNAAVEAAKKGPAAIWFALAGPALLLAFCSKEIATIWLGLFGLYLCMACRTVPIRQRVLAFCGGLLVLGGYAVLRQWPAPIPGAFVPSPPPLPPTLVLMARSLGDCVGLLICPGRLQMERQVFAAYGQTPSAIDTLRYGALFIFGALALGLLVAGIRWQAPGQRLRRFGAGWFLLAWLPVSNLWVLNASVAEHWLYLPSVGFLLFLAGCAAGLHATTAGERLLSHVPVALAAVLGLLTVRTHLRSADWFDDLTLSRQTLAAGSVSPRMRLMFAEALRNRDQTAAAEKTLRDLVADYPKFGPARQNLATLLARDGRRVEAGELLRTLRDSGQPADRVLLPTVLSNLALLPEETADDPAQALARVVKAVESMPQNWPLLELESRLLRQLGRGAESNTAIAGFQAARPWHYPAAMRWARCVEESGDFPRAEALYAAAGRLDVHEVASRRARGYLCLRAGRPENARQFAQEAISRQPQQAQNYLLLALACTDLGRSQEAALARATAAQLQALVPSP